MLSSLVLLTLIQVCVGHIALTYPPARGPALDFLDNIRTAPPCGVPRGYGPVTLLQAGSSLTVTWRIAFPHQGGFYLEILDHDDEPVIRYESEGTVYPEPETNPEPEVTAEPESTPETSPEPESTAEPEHSAEPEPGSGNIRAARVDYIGYNDTTTLQYTITLPDRACENCTLRLVRQALEWGGCNSPYLFWSCADINIVQDVPMHGMFKCSGHGQWSDNRCFCDPLYEGDHCQYKNDCGSSSDCSQHGECVDVQATSYPKRQCFCDIGWFGRDCSLRSTVTSRQIQYSNYNSFTFSPDFTLYYRELRAEEELEVVMRVKTNTWVGVGWKPTDFRSGCQLFPPLYGVSRSRPEQETTHEPEPEATNEPEPETTHEPEPETTHEPEPETTHEPEPGTTHEPEPESTVEPEPNSGRNRGLPPCNAGAPTSRHQTPVTEPEPEGEPEGGTTPEPEGETSPEPEGEARPEPEGEGTPEPEGEPGDIWGTGYPTATIRGDTDGARTHAMDCTDMVIGSARNDRSRIGDYYTRDRSTPEYDDFYGGENSLTAALGFEDGDETVILFRRKIRATERADHDIERAPMTVIWAKGQEAGKYTHVTQSGLDVDRASDRMFYRPDELKYHGHRSSRGSATLNLLSTPLPSGCEGAFPSVCDGCDIQVLWRLDTETEMVNFTLKARLGSNTRWIGLGFSDNTNMPMSDAVIGWMDGNSVSVTDRYLTGYSPPVVDDNNNIQGVTGSVVDGVTTIMFSRQRNTGDTRDMEFTDTDCPYLFLASGEFSATGVLRQHNTIPLISTRVCFSLQCATVGLQLIEQIVIGVAVAFILIGLIVIVCKCREMQTRRSSSVPEF